MKCRNCGEEMANYTVQAGLKRLSYDICESCGSLWLDKGELDKMAYQVSGSVEYSTVGEAEAEGEKKKECPRCEGVAMDKVNFLGVGDIVLDHCDNCGGFWLDGGELDLANEELERIMNVSGHGFSEFLKKAHLPFWVKRIKNKSSDTDFKIDVKPLGNAVRISETGLECPVCDEAKLDMYNVYGMQVDACPECHGIWLNEGELRRMKDRSVKLSGWYQLNWMDDEVESVGDDLGAIPSDRACPECEDEKMISTSFGDSGTVIEWCPGCGGIWLDAGEMDEIIGYMKKQLDSLSEEEMKEKVYEEIKEIWDGPEGVLSEIRDAASAIGTLINMKIYKHPRLVDAMAKFAMASRSVGF